MGICGFFQAEKGDEQARWWGVLEGMAAGLTIHKSTAVGTWLESGASLGLASCWPGRIDQPARSPQPLHSANGRYVLACEGQLYNDAALRNELGVEGVIPLDDSSAAFCLAAVETWGLPQALARIRGVFGIALWDAQTRRLHLIRDRLGEKPLYYGVQGGNLLFGSELKALRQHPAWRGEICPQALTQFLRYGYIPEPYSIYLGIYKLPPGSCLVLGSKELQQPETLALSGQSGPKRYWSVLTTAEAGLAMPWTVSPEEAVTALERLLRETIGEQLDSVAAPAAFLSGGIDSSTVAALLQEQSAQPVQTFTIGFSEATFNEAEYAKAVARHLGTDHTEVYISARDALDAIPRLPRAYDEPFADASQLPMLLLCEMTCRHADVAFAGDGGDELFAGYSRYLWVDKIWARYRNTPRWLRLAAAAGLEAVPAPRQDAVFALLQRLLPLKQLQQPNLGGKIHKLAAALRAEDATQLYRMLMSYWQQPAQVVSGAEEGLSAIRPGNTLKGSQSLINDLMYWDLISYLPGDILVKLDRAARHSSLQLRLPLLDQRLVEFAWRIPIDFKLREKQGKWLLRQVTERHIPSKMLERPKMGFSPPIGSWLRGSLREWGEDLLAEQRLVEQGLFDPELVRQSWHAHQVGHQDSALALWSVLMFQSWYDEQQQRVSPVLAEQAVRAQQVFAGGAAAAPAN